MFVEHLALNPNCNLKVINLLWYLNTIWSIILTKIKLSCAMPR